MQSARRCDGVLGWFTSITSITIIADDTHIVADDTRIVARVAVTCSLISFTSRSRRSEDIQHTWRREGEKAKWAQAVPGEAAGRNVEQKRYLVPWVERKCTAAGGDGPATSQAAAELRRYR